MIVIAENLNTRNRPYMDAVKKRDIKIISLLSKELSGAGADIINVQCSLDGVNDLETLPNVSTGVSKLLKSRLNSIFLSYLSGAGLDAVIVDALDPEIKKTIYLVKSFRDEIIFSPADIS